MTSPFPPRLKITFGQMRAQGIRRLVARCRNPHCGHFTVISGDRWRDEAWLSDAETGLICHVCHGKGADLAPEPPRRAASVDDDDKP